MADSMKVFCAVLVLFGAGLTEPVHSRTLTVEQDGSGDYTVIQDAVDAAESGDTILVGAGHYVEYTELPTADLCVWLDGTKNLTLIGAGSDLTIIGPIEYTPHAGSAGIACWPGDVSITVQGVRVVNHDLVGLDFNNVDASLVDSVVERCEIGYIVGGDIESVYIDSCQFVNGPNLGNSIALTVDAPSVRVQNTLVQSYQGGFNFDCPGSTDVHVVNCRFDADPVADNFGLVGIGFTLGGGGTVEGCYFTGWRNYGFVVDDAGTVVFRDNVIEGCRGTGIGLEGCDDLTVENNVVSNCSPCVFIGESNDHATIRGNHFLRDSVGGGASGLFIDTPSYCPWGPFYFDFSNNYWGTTDTDLVSTYIVDGYDDEDVWFYVDFLPLAEGPVRTEFHSWSSVKGLFEGGGEE